MDSSGKIYVAEAGQSAIDVFAASPVGATNEAPLAEIVGTSTHLDSPTGIAFDASGIIYATNATYPGYVTLYAANPKDTVNEAPLATIEPGNDLVVPTSVGLDASGKIYVPNPANPAAVFLFAANPSGTSAAPRIGTITGSQTSLSNIAALAISSASVSASIDGTRSRTQRSRGR